MTAECSPNAHLVTSACENRFAAVYSLRDGHQVTPVWLCWGDGVGGEVVEWRRAVRVLQ
jgi:hypothetical protein